MENTTKIGKVNATQTIDFWDWFNKAGGGGK